MFLNRGPMLPNLSPMFVNLGPMLLNLRPGFARLDLMLTNLRPMLPGFKPMQCRYKQKSSIAGHRAERAQKENQPPAARASSLRNLSRFPAERNMSRRPFTRVIIWNTPPSIATRASLAMWCGS